MTTKDALLQPLEMRFTEPADIEKYGDRWFVYDELAIVTTSAKKLMRWEAEIGAPLSAVMNGVRESSVFGDTAAAWLAVKMTGGGELAGRFSEFDVATMLIEWRPKAEEEPGKAPTPEPETDPTPGPPTTSGSTGQPDTVVLPIMPEAASPSS